MHTNTVQQILRDLFGAPRILIVVSVGFEERCLHVPQQLAQHAATDSSFSKRLKVICVEPRNENVAPAAIAERDRSKKVLTELLNPEYVASDAAWETIRRCLDQYSRDGTTVSVGIDASTMRRELLYDIIGQLLERRSSSRHPDLVQLYYTQPADYHEGPFETPSPATQLLVLGPHTSSRVGALVVFPGFNINDSCVIVARTLSHVPTDRPLLIRWAFCHPGAKLEFYERARGNHSALLQYLESQAHVQQEVVLCRMDDMLHIAQTISDAANGLQDGDALRIAVSGPRILLSAAYLTGATIASKRSRQVEMLLTQPLSYSSARSKGIGPSHAWSLWPTLNEIERAVS